MATVVASLLRKRRFPVQPSPHLKGDIDDFRQRPLPDSLGMFTDAELLEEDWFLWCIDHIYWSWSNEFQLLRGLLQ